MSEWLHLPPNCNFHVSFTFPASTLCASPPRPHNSPCNVGVTLLQAILVAQVVGSIEDMEDKEMPSGPSQGPNANGISAADAPIHPAPKPVTPTSTNPTPPNPLALSASGPGSAHAPPLGTRIEVLWRIESPDEGDQAGEIVDKWWGAVVQDCTSQMAGSLVKPEWAGELVHTLLYDAWGEFGEDTVRVVFVPKKSLVDLARLDDENGGVLDWRVEGGDMSMEEVAEENEALVQEAGLSSDADLAVLSQYPANVQINVASGYRVFADGVKEMLGELVASKPRGYVVTESDVQGIFERIQRMKAEGVDVGM